MSTRFGSCAFVALSCCVWAATASVAFAEEPTQLGPPEQIALTLYSDGQALVRESRRASLTRGRNHVIVTSLPVGLDVTSIRVEAEGVTLVEVRDGSANLPYQTGPGSDDAPNPRASIRSPQGEVVGEWVLEAERSMEGAVTVSYLVPGIQYSASLDVVFDEQGGTELDGWITIQNRTGIRHSEASVVLVTAPARKSASPQNAQVRRREISLAEPVAIEPGQGRRVRVLSRRPALGPERTVVEGGRLREHDERLPSNQKLSRNALGTEPVHAEVRRRLGADDVAALARVLPPLARRVYLKSRNGPELLYEDRVDPVTMSPEVTLKRADDLRVERRQLQFTRRKDPTVSEETIEIVVANDGVRPARVELLENLFRSRNFEIQSASRDLDVESDLGRDLATTTLTVAAGKQVKLTYTVVYRP